MFCNSGVYAWGQHGKQHRSKISPREHASSNDPLNGLHHALLDVQLFTKVMDQSAEASLHIKDVRPVFLWRYTVWQRLQDAN